MINLYHKDCGGILEIDVEISGITGIFKTRVKNIKQIEITYDELRASNVMIKAVGLFCQRCGEKNIPLEDITFRCQMTGKNDVIENFVFIYGTHPDNRNLHPVFCHKDFKDKYVEDISKDGFVADILVPEVVLNKEARNG
jgi:hypothetical protein